MISNLQIAEWLLGLAATSEGHRNRACRRAAHRALFWPVEAAEVEDLQVLEGVGPWLAHEIRSWLREPPSVAPPDPTRVGFSTMAEARRVLDAHPGWRGRARGDLQMHTEWSDGKDTIAAMAAAAEERGYEYIAITDHTKGLPIAGGLSEERMAEQHAEIATVNEALAEQGCRVRVLRSAEMNLSPAGEGDMEPDFLRGLDLVLGAFHSRLRATEDQTDRYLAALRNPHVHVLGHPRGRVYNFRLGLTADWDRVFAEAARLDKAVEVDGYPDRQDLDVELLRKAADAGCRISLGTDAHNRRQLAFLDLSLAACLRAGVAPDRILNFMPRDELLEWARRRGSPPRPG